MKKQTTTKIILGLIIFVFVVSIFQFALPIQAATDTSMANLYSNPNRSDNTYKFKISDVVSSGLLTNVVGCTGIVNKVSTWMVKFISSPKQQAEMLGAKITKMKNQLKSACLSTKAASEAAGDSIPIIGGLSKSIDTILSKIPMPPIDISVSGKKDGLLSNGLAPGPGNPQSPKSNSGNTAEKLCLDQVDATDSKALEQMIKDAEAEAAKTIKEQCFDGIAITLAKNQLTAMTRSMMNWVNSGYGGNPFFVQNMRNFTNNIERNVLETGIDILLAPGNQNPYASDFARSAITGRGLGSSSSNFLGNLQSDLGSFITDPKSYYTDAQLNDAERTQMALLRAQEANNAFANDFSVGGWNAYLALTQRDQNNPLGFTMLASQYLADQMAFETQNAKDELAQNDGFLSQKTCILWNKMTKNAETGKTELTYDDNGKIKTTTNPNLEIDECVDWKTITPGSLIKEKTTSYLNSPERQLELAKTINDSLNALFSVLISKLQGGGLSGLSDSATDAPMNWTDNMNEFTSPDGNTPYNNNGAYDGFNLTRDLGNTYIHATPKSLGKWNAKDNCVLVGTTCPKEEKDWVKLYPDLAPEVLANESPNNTYYTVSTAGNTKLLLEGYNGWAVDDRAFWDGEKWQNWKKGQTNPLKKKGVIQTQQDYIVAGKEILGVLPSIMPKLGELDYCLPGPNPSYKTNSTDAQSAYQDWIGSMYVGAYDNTGSRYGVRIDTEGKRTYDNLQNIYADNTNVWDFISSKDNSEPLYIEPLYKPPYSMRWIINTFSNICNDPRFLRHKNCNGGYFYEGGNLTEDENNNLKDKTSIMNEILDYVNNKMFQDFYTTFDKAMNKLYFNNMVNKYNDTETSIGLPGTENSDYIPMSVTGLDLTKNILYYNDDIVKATGDYTEAIAQAKINIAKLEPIKTEVSGIIKTAQDRRNKNLQDLLGLTAKEIQDKYATCFAEENIKFYDADTITNMGSVGTENCSDGIDNDLNGLVDMADTPCWPNGINPSTGRRSDTGTGTGVGGSVGSCSNGAVNTNLDVPEGGFPPSDSCVSRPTSSACANSPYYYGNAEIVCVWSRF